MSGARVFHGVCLALLAICLSAVAVSAADVLPAGTDTGFAIFQRILSSSVYRLDDRREVAILLLERGWSEGINEVLAVLENNEDSQGQLAVAEALAETLPKLDSLPNRFVDPLIAALSSEEERLRQAAALALANYNDKVLPQLEGIILQSDPTLTEATRLAAVAAVERIKEKKSVQILIKALEVSSSQLSARCRQGLERLTGIPRGDDNDVWRLWWEQNKDRDLADWRLFYLTALIDQNRELRKAIKQLREELQSQIEVRWDTAQDQAEFLGDLLANPLEDVRLQGLYLAKDLLTGAFPEKLRVNIRKLLADPSAPVRASAAELLRDLRDKQAVTITILLERLPNETEPKVRASFAEALGYIGGAKAVQPLIKLLDEPDSLVVGKAALALGNLVSDKDVEPQKTSIVEALLKRYEKIIPINGADAELRSQILSAMAQVGSPSFREVFFLALQDSYARSRAAAVEGLRLFPNRRKETLDAIRPLLADPNRSVRLEVLRAFDDLADPGELETLEKRLDPNVEPDTYMRDEVWGVFTKLLAKADLKTLNDWERRFAADDNAERHEQVLGILEAKLTQDQPNSIRLIEVREKRGDLFAASKSWEAAAEKYRLAYEARTISVPSISKTRDGLALKLLKALLNQGAFDQAAEHLEAIAAAASPLEKMALVLTLDHLETLLDLPGASKSLDAALEVLENARLPGLSQPPLSDRLSGLKAKALNLHQSSNKAPVVP